MRTDAARERDELRTAREFRAKVFEESRDELHAWAELARCATELGRTLLVQARQASV